MKAENQHTPELAHVCRLIEDIPVAMLTTHDASGALVSRPMSPLEMDAAGALWFFTDAHSSKTKHLDAANLSFVDPAHATYVSLAGKAEIQTDPARIEHLWSPLAKPWFPGGPDTPELALLKFVPESVEFWDAPNSRMVRMFALAASLATGVPLGQGEHETLANLSGTVPKAGHD